MLVLHIPFPSLRHPFGHAQTHTLVQRSLGQRLLMVIAGKRVPARSGDEGDDKDVETGGMGDTGVN